MVKKGIFPFRIKTSLEGIDEMTIYYNTIEDQLDIAREQGRDVYVDYLWWEHTKTRDMRDWRVLRQGGKLKLYNLLDEEIDVKLVLPAAAVSGAKRVQSSTGRTAIFPAGKMARWELGEISLPPHGQMKIDIVSSPDTARIPLLAGMVEIRVSPADRTE